MVKQPGLRETGHYLPMLDCSQVCWMRTVEGNRSQQPKHLLNNNLVESVFACAYVYMFHDKPCCNFAAIVFF